MRRALALLASIALFVTAFCAFIPSSHAATGDIELDTPTITTTKDTMQQWDTATMSFNWSAPDGINGGESFTVTFPDEINPPYDLTFPLKDASSTVGGTCIVSNATQSMTCTLDDTFAGMDDVGGTINLQVQAMEVTEPGQESVNIDLNGKVIPIDLPVGPIVGDEVAIPEDSQKWGWANANFTEFTWMVIVPGTDLVNLGSAPVTIADQLSPNHTYIPGTFSLYEKTGAEFAENAYYANADERLAFTGPQISADGHRAEIIGQAPRGGWNPANVYVLYYQTTTTDGQPAQYLEQFQNKANVDGKVVSSKVEREVQGDGTIGGVPRASFDIEKKMTADSAAIPADTVFTVEAVIESPVDSFDETKTYSVRPGEVTNGGTLLPAGTVVTLREIDLPEISGIEFGTPKFAAKSAADSNVQIAADGASVTLTIVQEANAEVVLTNSAAQVETTTPEPTTETTTPEPTTETTTPEPTTETTTPAPTTTTTPGLPLIPLIPLIPIFIGGSSGSADGPGSSNNGGNVPEPQPVPSVNARQDAVLGIAAPAPAEKGISQIGASKSAPQQAPQRTQRILANTGANTQWALLLGVVLAAIGLGVLIRTRRSN